MNDAESEEDGYGRLVRAKIVNSGVSLSERERLIVLLMGRGLSDKAIARQMSIAPETVSSHARRIVLKLSVQTRAQAIFRATTLGLI